MSPEPTGPVDPARTLARLWRAETPRGRGPSRGLGLDAVVVAGTDVADAEGLDAVTMRRVAAELGVAPMTLYTYVAGRSEMLVLMVDAAWAAMPHRDTTGLAWRDRLRAVADENLALHVRHPWVVRSVPVGSSLRPLLGPGETAKYEHELAAFNDTAADDVTRDLALTHLLAFVLGSVRARQAAVADSSGPSGLTDEQWWEQVGPLLAEVVDPSRFPRATRVGTAAGSAHGSAHDPDAAYRFGLARVLDGLAPVLDPA